MRESNILCDQVTVAAAATELLPAVARRLLRGGGLAVLPEYAPPALLQLAAPDPQWVRRQPKAAAG
jgi:hypothetical protein